MCCMTDSDMPVIDSKTLRQKIKENSVRLIDVRREQEYQQGHITNAINLPLAKLLADDSAEAIQKIAQDLGISDETSVVVYDDTFGHYPLELSGHYNTLDTKMQNYLM